MLAINFKLPVFKHKVLTQREWKKYDNITCNISIFNPFII